jgi:hypothetical protein
MTALRVIALPTETVHQALTTLRSPGYGHPVHREMAKGHGPCRHCLKPFRVGEEERALFTCNPFDGLAEIPAPGPVFVHAESCERFDEDAGYPPELLAYPVVLDAYDGQQVLLAQRRAIAGDPERVLIEMFADDAVQYILVRDLTAGCFDFRVERRATA